MDYSSSEDSGRAIKLISLNIELDRHLDLVIPFLREEDPDVICLQEVFLKEMPIFKKQLLMEGDFVAGCVLDTEMTDRETLRINEKLMEKGPEGIALFTKLPALSSRVDYYRGEKGEIPRWSVGQHRMLLSRTVTKGGKEYTIGTTHFTWTPDGESSDEQRLDVKELLQVLERFPHIVFCGDFNAPRGGEIWGELAQRYRDNIPTTYKSSIDPHLHRVKGLTQMVDGFFSTPEYRASNVRLVGGLSDHKAIVGMIERTAHSA